MTSDIGLALRLVRGAGRRDATRFIAMVTGVAFAVVALLIGLAAPRVSNSARSIETNRTPVYASSLHEAPPAALRVVVSDDTVGERPWTHVVAAGVSSGAPLPPGLSTWPGTGETVVSPALAELLKAQPNLTAQLAPLVREHIGPSGLVGPDELYSYTVVASDPGVASTPAVTGFGGEGTSDQGTPLRILLIETSILVVLPALVFIFVCLRLSARSRSARMFALSLVGMSPSRAAALYSSEMTITATAGVAMGMGIYFAIEGPLGASGLLGVQWWPAQARVTWITAVLCMVFVVLGVAKLAKRVMARATARSRSQRADDAPGRFSVTAAATTLPAVGFLAMADWHGWRQPSEGWATGGYSALVATCIGIGLLGIAIGVPAVAVYLGRALAPRANGALKLGLRGASATSFGGAGRLISFVAVMVIVAGLGSAFLASLQNTSLGNAASAHVAFDLADVPHAERERLDQLPRQPYTIDSAVPYGHHAALAVEIGDCPGVRRAAAIVFGTVPACADAIQRGNGAIGGGSVRNLKVGDTRVAVPPAPITARVTWDLKFPIAAAPWARDLPSGTVTFWVSRADGSYATTLAAVHRLFPGVHVDAGLKDPVRYAVFRQQEGVIHAGLVLGLALSIMSFVISTLESRWARERSVVALAALGVSNGVLRRANAVQFTFPVLIGGLCSAVVGTLGGWAFLSFYGTKAMFASAVPAWCAAALAASVVMAAAAGWASGGGRFQREAIADV